jgi:(1->4)-alpha-D-glucan 1-alpha-D-glucosylmutase
MRGLALRHRWHETFAAGDYLPLNAEGEAAEHLFAFARKLEDRVVVAVVPRHFYRLTHQDPATAAASTPTSSPRADWRNTALVLPANAPEAWRCEFSGRTLQAVASDDTLTLRAADLFDILPVALLTASKD